MQGGFTLLSQFQVNLAYQVNSASKINSAFYPQQDGKWAVAYGLWDDRIVQLIGAVVCLLDAPQVQLFAGVGNGLPQCH